MTRDEHYKLSDKLNLPLTALETMAYLISISSDDYNGNDRMGIQWILNQIQDSIKKIVEEACTE